MSKNERDDRPQRVFPGGFDAPLQSQDEWEETEPLVSLATLPADAAQRLLLRIEREGILCDLTDLPVEQAELRVRRSDLAEAQRLLHDDSAPAGEDDLKWTDEEFDKAWVCPRCRKSLNLQPFLNRWPPWRVGAVVSLLIAMVLLFFGPADRAVADWIHFHGNLWTLAWVVVVVGLCGVIAVAPTLKYCPGCGWKSGSK